MTGIMLGLGLYFIPTIVALARKEQGNLANIGPLIVVNVFLGWTFVGWVVALAMACQSKGPAIFSPTESDGE